MPKLRSIRLLVSLPFSWPITITGVSLNRASPPITAWSSAKFRSPASGVYSVNSASM
jgi:hypothetical protein